MQIGANLAEMEALQSSFTGRARDAETLRSQLESAVTTHITANWSGPAAEAFRDAWNSQFRPALDNLTRALDEAASEVQNRRNAIEQAGS